MAFANEKAKPIADLLVEKIDPYLEKMREADVGYYLVVAVPTEDGQAYLGTATNLSGAILEDVLHGALELVRAQPKPVRN